MIRVLVVDDHSLFRCGLVHMLEDGGVAVVGEAGEGGEAIRRATQLSPDVVLMDLHMPGVDGVEATRALAARFPVLVLTISDEDEDLFRAVEAGARGYLLKCAEPDELLRGVRAVAAGQSVLSPEVTRTALRALQRGPRSALPDLSARQREVLVGIARGRSYRQIAEELGVSPHTVKTHAERLYERLGVHSRPALLRVAADFHLD